MAQRAGAGNRGRVFLLAVLAAVVPGAAMPQEPPGPPAPAPQTRRVRDDKRRTVRSYGHNLLYDAVAVPGRANQKSLLITAALTAPAFAWDAPVQDYFARHPHETFGHVGQVLGGGLAVAGVGVGFFAIGRVANGDRFRAATYDASQAIIINGAYTQVLKLIVHRERPDHSNRLSFPSGHASNAFAIAGVISHHYGRLGDVAGYAVATFVATSRLAANKHHLSDVVAGAGLGIVVGHTVARRNDRPPGSGDAGHGLDVAVVPEAGPAGDGRGFALRVGF